MKDITLSAIASKLGLVLGGVSVFLVPLKPYIAALIIIMIMDVATRIMAVIKKKGWKGVKSSKMFHTVPKFIIYCFGLVAGHSLQSIEPSIPVTKVIAYFIAVVEFKSVSENIYDYTGANIFDALKEYMNNRGIKGAKEE